MEFWPILLGTTALSITHALIPNHWIPLTVLARQNQWSKPELASAAFLTALAHALSTVILGLVLGQIGVKLSHRFEEFTHLVAPLVLIIMGLVYLSLGVMHASHQHGHPDTQRYKNRSKWAIVASLSFAMFFSPCLEVESYFLSAGAHGMGAVIVLALIYTVITVAGILTMVMAGNTLMKKINLHAIEHQEHKISGLLLILIGIVSFWMH